MHQARQQSLLFSSISTGYQNRSNRLASILPESLYHSWHPLCLFQQKATKAQPLEQLEDLILDGLERLHLRADRLLDRQKQLHIVLRFCSLLLNVYIMIT